MLLSGDWLKRERKTPYQTVRELTAPRFLSVSQDLLYKLVFPVSYFGHRCDRSAAKRAESVDGYERERLSRLISIDLSLPAKYSNICSSPTAVLLTSDEIGAWVDWVACQSCWKEPKTQSLAATKGVSWRCLTYTQILYPPGSNELDRRPLAV